MKRILAITLSCLLVCTGCASTPSTSSTPSVPDDVPPITETDGETLPPFEGDVLPVISIVTEKTGDDALAFVTDPVAPHVSAQIASWTPGYQMPPAPWYEPCSITVTDGGTALLSAPAQVKVRGNWTTTYDKKPLRIKFDEKQSVLGLNGGEAFKSWVLLALYKDTSLLRDKTALAMARDILGADGLYAADSQLVEVTVDGQYWGVYLLTEQQQVDGDRIDITKPADGYEGTDIGYLLEFDGYYTEEDDLHSFTIGYAENAPLVPFDGQDESGLRMTPLPVGRHDVRPVVGYTIKSDVYSAAQRDCIAARLEAVYEVMYAAAYEDRALVLGPDGALTEADIAPQEAVSQVADLDSLADMYLLCELTCDADLYWSSFFLTCDLGPDGDGRLRFEAPWDFDSTMGNKDRCADGTGLYAANILWDVNDQYQSIQPWLAVLIHEDWFQDIVREKWAAARDGGVFDRALAGIASDMETCADAFARDEARWDTLTHNEASSEWTVAVRRCRTHADTAAILSDWLTARVAFLDTVWG